LCVETTVRTLANFVALVSLYALIAVSLSGCFGDSEFAYKDGFGPEETASIDTIGSAEEELQFGDDFWVQLAQSYDEFVPEPGIGAAVDAGDRINQGRWGELIEWPEIAVGAANMADGRIVTWASYVDDFFGAGTEQTTASIFDPDTGVFEDAGYTGHNMFCAGISMLPGGRVFIAGGGTHVSTVSVFEDNKFREIESMAVARWYPTSTTLASGQVLTSLGTTASTNSELWTQGYGWQLLDNVDLASALDFSYNYNDWYPALNVSPDGSVFHPGPNNEIFSINLDQEDGYTAHGPREVNGSDRLYNTTVIYDVGKMLVAGGGQLDSKNTALTIDLNGATPVVEPAEPMKNARSMQNSVVLPNGEVLVIGGNTSGRQFSDDGSILTPEIWNPDSGEWREGASHIKPRNYHSTALLLQDARVISMGGGLCGACKTNHQDGQIFEPPYLFDELGLMAARPSIDNGPLTASAGDALTLTGSDDIVEFNMVRLAAVTHHHSTDQRLVPVQFSKVTTGNYELSLNANPNVLIPGYYWIFGLNQNGVPSVGHQIEVLVTSELVETPATTDTNINYAYYEGFWTALPDFETLTPVATGTQSNFSLNNRERNWGYGFVFTGLINVPDDGNYTFFLSSDDGSRLSIDGNVVVDHDGNHRFEEQKTGSTFLTAGQHEIKVEYYEGTANDGLLVSWSKDGQPKRPVTRFDLGSEVVEIPAAVAPTTPVTTPITTPVTPPVTAPDPQVVYSYYEGDWNTLPSFDSLQPVKTGTLNNFSLAPREQNDFYGFRFDSRINVEVTGAGDDLEVFWSGPGFTSQAIADATFVEFVDTSTDAKTPAASTTGLVNYSYYEGNWNALPSFDSLPAVKTGSVANYSLLPREQNDFYGFRFDSRVTVETAGAYTFYTRSDDGSKLFVNGQLVVDNDGLHSVKEQNGIITLASGEHDVRVEYFERTGGDDLQVLWSGPGLTKQLIADAAFVPL